MIQKIVSARNVVKHFSYLLFFATLRIFVGDNRFGHAAKISCNKHIKRE